jgi:WD repeat-containing protein 68
MAEQPRMPTASDAENDTQGKEIYTYTAPWTVFAMAWSHRYDPQAQFRLAIGSYVERYSNSIQIIKKKPSDQSDDLNPPIHDSSGAAAQAQQDSQMYKACEFDHPYPCTKVLWNPDLSAGGKDLVATTGDYLRIWNLEDDGSGIGTMTAKKEVMLNSNKKSEYCAPLTSFDWNEADPSLIGTASIDTTCTIWDVTTQKARTQLIAHEREVYDIAFAEGKDIFGSVGADGSVRMFDLRRLDHSTIIFESPQGSPLLRLEWNKQDPNYLATFTEDSPMTFILDVRMPSSPVAELGGHVASVNASAWAPHSYCHMCTAGDDSQALIWDLSKQGEDPNNQNPFISDTQNLNPILAYNAEGEINNLQWSTTQWDWISIVYRDKLQILRV